MQGNNHQAGIGREVEPVYNLFNSQWYIQWLRTLRNRGAERVPIRSKAGRQRTMPAGSFHFGKNIDASDREANNPRDSRRPHRDLSVSLYTCLNHKPYQLTEDSLLIETRSVGAPCLHPASYPRCDHYHNALVTVLVTARRGLRLKCARDDGE